MKWLRARLNEPSTHAGLAVLFVLARTVVPQYAAVADALAALCATIAAAAPEQKPAGLSHD